MPHFAVTLPLLASMLALAHAEDFQLSAIARLPETPPTATAPPAPLPPKLGYPATTAPAEQKDGQDGQVFVLTQVPAGAAATGALGQDDAVCDEVAARIKPQLTPKPAYPGPLQGLATHLGGIQYDNCKEFSFNGGNAKLDGTDNFKKFSEERYTTFIVPIWAKVHELWEACGDKAGDFDEVKNEPCYKWAFEQCQASKAGSGTQNAATEEKKQPAAAQPGDSAAKPSGSGGGLLLFGGAGKSVVPHAVAVGVAGAAGLMAFLWVMV
ncbi:uncharacterized protein B0T15DRAFT_435290 [Chaetomium strumarium]|uniref:Uncharacterized protein n=1 Tax=Chaetomium strumarium TaxID=1170767 RepID=A0AAJ0M1Z7_9PEZI|nr:hypothetical protein B0T15DRAFT_435290 [Chaetomium strumarium]